MTNHEDIPVLMTIEDVVAYRKCSRATALDITKGLPVAGTYTPPRGTPVSLYSRYDLRVCCENDHVLKPPGSKICRQCRYEAKYGRRAA
jgi:hypothetical protein